ncbi:predicted protein [Uncinocarpus reesii 1704]|uniref:Uncharacterized protein n=1 Tax=Uncinocarpus reesii (strain UAMH 1704) TaxID=336963 RepID=C4JDZ8_UNCRE|nr:uncharacterized protein UREG_00422 [Uncinocarpus reesii 1704]EEP75576.1 predicted protein [Uncinocarpus reesii 1704]
MQSGQATELLKFLLNNVSNHACLHDVPACNELLKFLLNNVSNHACLHDVPACNELLKFLLNNVSNVYLDQLGMS